MTKFEWDEVKAGKVLNERGIDFDDAAIALASEPILVTPSP